MTNPNGSSAVADPVKFTVSSVTGGRHLDYDNVDGHRGVAELSTSIAASLELPSNIPYAIRDDKRGRMLDEGAPVGSQIPTEGAELVLVPKSHLGSGTILAR